MILRLKKATVISVVGRNIPLVTLLEGAKLYSLTWLASRREQEHNTDTSQCWCRIELEHVVTASNLFKYCQPCHGLVLFKHHHPLQFNQQQLAELLRASQQWFMQAQQMHPDAQYPFFLWNCLPR